MYTGTLPPVSNRASWAESIECTDDADRTLIDLGGATEIIVEIADCGRAVIVAKLSAGQIVLGTLGVFSFAFTADQMSGLRARTYDFNVLISWNGMTQQAIAAQLPVINGKDR